MRKYLRPFVWAIVLLLVGAVAAAADRQRLVDNLEVVKNRLQVHAAADRIPDGEVPILLERIANDDCDYVELPAGTTGRNNYVSRGRSLEYRPSMKTYRSSKAIKVFKFGPDDQLPVARCFMDKGCINLWEVYFPPYKPPPLPVVRKHRIRINKTVVCNLDGCSEIHSGAGFSFKLMRGTSVCGEPVTTSAEGYATFDYQAVAGSYSVCEELTSEQSRAGFSCFKTSMEVIVTGSSSDVVQISVTNLFKHKPSPPPPVVKCRVLRIFKEAVCACGPSCMNPVHRRVVGFGFAPFQNGQQCRPVVKMTVNAYIEFTEILEGEYEVGELLTEEECREGYSCLSPRGGRCKVVVEPNSPDVIEIRFVNLFTPKVIPPPAPPELVERFSPFQGRIKGDNAQGATSRESYTPVGYLAFQERLKVRQSQRQSQTQRQDQRQKIELPKSSPGRVPPGPPPHGGGKPRGTPGDGNGGSGDGR